MNRRRLLPTCAVVFLFLVPILSNLNNLAATKPDLTRGIPIDVGNGQTVEVEPGELLHKFVVSEQGNLEWIGTADPLISGEFGNATDHFQGNLMMYLASNTTTGTNVSVPTGSGWEGYRVDAQISQLTENRSWVRNWDFNSTPTSSDWTGGFTDVGSYSTPVSSYNSSGHGVGDGTFDFEIDSGSTSAPFYYDQGDRAYATQSMSIPRGDVVWAAFRTDYWADTQDDTHYGMTGSFAIYLNIEASQVWQMVFTDIDAEETWYDSGLTYVSPDIFGLPGDQDVTVEIGLWSKASVGYDPEIGPRAKVDNFELYVKTRAAPSDVNLAMNGISVSSDPGYGSGYVTEVADSPWVDDPVVLNFTWSPTPTNPDPNRKIIVEFDVETNMFARRLDIPTVYEISPTSYGQRYVVRNATEVNYTTYFYATIPTGYVNRYYFNQTIPLNRDVFSVAKPLAPSTNLTSGWSGGHPGDGYLNVSAYDVATEAGRYGYWRIRSSAPNMIQDLEVYDPNDTTWKRTTDLRAGNSTRVRAYVGSTFQDAIVNITVYDADGVKMYSVNATADGSGYAATPFFNLAGSNSSAGSWMVQASTNDFAANGEWQNTGFFRRAFTVTHSSELVISYPDDAVGTWTTNVTFGDLVLLIVEANDTDSDILVPGGNLQYTWYDGTDSFDDSGNGEYTKVLDTSVLPGKGQYDVDLTWSKSSYDSSQATITLNVNYASTLESPQYPGISGAIGSDQSFNVSFKNVNGTGIQGALVTCNWSQSYNVTEQGLGVYTIDLDSSGVPLDEYPVSVQAKAPFVETADMIMYVEVREIYNRVSHSANRLSIPVGESDSFTLTWFDSELDVPITGGESYITCNWTPFHESGEQNYTVVEIDDGVYEITIFTEDDDEITGTDDFYDVVFNVRRQNYQNHTFSIGVQVRSHNTLFVLDSPVEQTPYGQNITVLVEYRDTDLGTGINNVSGNVQISVSSSGAPDLLYSVSESSLGEGHYNITIASDQWGTIGWKDLIIEARWVGAVEKYYNQTISTEVRVLGTATDLFLEQAPTATYYLNNFTFTVVYYDTVNGTRISNASTGDVWLRISAITSGHPVTQNDFEVTELVANPGTYKFSLDSSRFGLLGTFKFQIDFEWSEGVSPLYENKTLTVSLIILERPTYVDYSSADITPYGEDAYFQFSYIDSLTSVKIENSSSLSISLNEGGVSYSLGYDSGTRTFAMAIDTATLGGTGTFTLHLNLSWVGEPYYTSISSKSFSITVTLRSTQLTHLSFTPPQWGNDVSIEFVYTDLITGSSSGMTGNLVLNTSLEGWYEVTGLGNGHYLVKLNTSFSTTGIFMINATIVYNGTNFAADATETFSLSILNRVTQLGYDSPDPAPYGTNVSFTVSYSDDTTGTQINGAAVLVSCDDSTDSLLLGDNYWFTDVGNGDYLILVDTQALGGLATYSLNVTLSWSGEPYYATSGRFINARVVERPTQILMTETPGETPFEENVTFSFRFTDYLTGQVISINKTHITLVHGPTSTPIASDEYSLDMTGDIYQISLLSTVLDSENLVTAHEIRLLVNKSGVEPYYASREKTTQATTTERPTQILFPLVEDTPLLDNITVEFEFVDYLSEVGIENASATVSFTNLTSATYYLEEIGEGIYRIRIPTSQFGGAGVIFFNITMGKTGIPFYSNRTTSDVPATIRLIQTTLTAEAPPLGSQPLGDIHRVNVTFTDADHGGVVSDALVTTNWEALYGTDVVITETAEGIYQIAINTSGLIAQKYPFEIQAQLENYSTGIVSVTIQPAALTVEIVMERTTYYADWGSMVHIVIEVEEPYYGTLVPGMDAILVWNDTEYTFTDNEDGTYELYLNTRDNDYGTYQPQITVSREFYQTRQRTFTLSVSRGTGQIVLEQSIFNVVTDTDLVFWIYLNDTGRNEPVIADEVSIEWNATDYVIPSNGTPGFYTVSLNTSGFALGEYELIVRAIETNFAFLETSVDVNIVPVPTRLQIDEDITHLTVYYGSSIVISVDYINENNNQKILGANLTYTLGTLSGALSEQPDGSYRATINTTLIGSQTLYLRLTASRVGYSTSQLRSLASIVPLPTKFETGTPTQSGYHDYNVTYLLYLNDTYNDQPIIGAELAVIWDGGSGTFTDNANGTYTVTVFINVTVPRNYEIQVQGSLDNYDTASIRLILAMARTPAHIEGTESLSIPIGEGTSAILTVINDLTEETITDVNGLAFFEGIGQAGLTQLGNGSFALDVPSDLPIGLYTIEVIFTGTMYSVPVHTIDLDIRRIRTTLMVSNTTIQTIPGSAVQVTITYWDLDHGVGIEDVIPDVSFGTGSLTYYPDRLQSLGNGTYVLLLQVNEAGTFGMTVAFTKDLYETRSIQFEIRSDPSAAQVLTQALTTYGSIGLIILAALLFMYVRIWSVPKLVRVMNAMIRKLARGGVPKPAEVPSRRKTILQIANEELRPSGVTKTLEEVEGETIQAIVPEVNELLERLAEITGLGDEEIEAFRADLARMKPSERTGFIKEVIVQEEARRADELAGIEESEAKEEPTLGDLPEELQDLKMKLEKKGMSSDEIDTILEEAKNLSKADLKALLESLGIDID